MLFLRGSVSLGHRRPLVKFYGLTFTCFKSLFSPAATEYQEEMTYKQPNLVSGSEASKFHCMVLAPAQFLRQIFVLPHNTIDELDEECM